ncbi:(2Fe-2S)-binding protein [Virgibacillus litoralis]|uniref:Sarcosine oxidase subunit alpha n=1 Tax=Virgibacillus litoralis TaxID=578221 RepID=A0ABS4HJ52_9BACI|nr:(2Fe-2S)-binding protein [Virgibacillus litoralis]MBP1950955.1 sarcosine oxidase subunit alpha [Virgibacillus litoralis]
MMRITDHPILEDLEKRPVTITFNGMDYQAYEGESIAAALLANHIRVLRYSEKNREPRGIYCGIGHCYECRVTVDGKRSVRACITKVRDQMCIKSQDGDDS